VNWNPCLHFPRQVFFVYLYSIWNKKKKGYNTEGCESAAIPIIKTLYFKFFERGKKRGTFRMSWSQDVVLYVLLPFLLPSLPVSKKECWLKRDIRCVFEYLFIHFCSVSLQKTERLLYTFVKKELSLSTSKYETNLDFHLHFLTDIENRCSFRGIVDQKSSVHFFYASSFLIEQKVDLHEDEDYALKYVSKYGYKDTVALLLQHKADVHAEEDYSLRWASHNGHTDIVAALLEHKADVHANGDYPLILACANGYKDTVGMLLEHKADIHVNKDYALQLASIKGYKDIVVLLLEHKAHVHVDQNSPIQLASIKGYTDIVVLLLEHKADVHAL
jgi:hypothetical protein